MLLSQKNLNAFVIMILSGVLLAAFSVQIFMHEVPCPLCLLQRIGMIGVALGLALNLWFGIQMPHYGISISSAIFGGFVALRQISLHVCPGFPVFGIPVLGLSLYTWSFVVFTCSVLAIGLMFFLYSPKSNENTPASLNTWQKTSLGLIFFVTLSNVVTTFLQCGFGLCTD